MNILLVDDEPLIRLTLGRALTGAGHTVQLAANGEEASRLAENGVFELLVTDIRLPGIDGLVLFRQIQDRYPDIDVILMTAFGSIDDAVAALKRGVTDYMTKPFEAFELVHEAARLAEKHHLRSELAAARRALPGPTASHAIVGNAPAITRLLDRIGTFATSDAPVLITGESGTGKELVAKTLHDLSPRANRPFVAVSCAAFPETLIDAELFGHERGAFTGAVRKRDGRFQQADSGTLFLDEIAEIPLPAQAKLLRVLQEGSFEPLGTNQSINVDVRIISATHRDLKAQIREGLFREDLYYRLKVLELHIPSLRERPSDIPVLTEYFLKDMAIEGTSPKIEAAAWAALRDYNYPGNVRELQHAVLHATVLSRGADIDIAHLPAEIASGLLPGDSSFPGQLPSLAHAIRVFEREHVLRAMRLTSGKRIKTARLLGISRKNLWEKLRSLDIREEEWM